MLNRNEDLMGNQYKYLMIDMSILFSSYNLPLHRQHAKTQNMQILAHTYSKH